MNKDKIIFGFLIIVGIAVALFVYFHSPKEEMSQNNAVTVSTISISNATSPAAAVLAGGKTIRWQTENYPADAGVNINLIRKVSDSPKQFTLVRTLETNTSNDGEQVWVPGVGELSGDLYVEVTCSNDYQFKSSCSLGSEPIKVQ